MKKINFNGITVDNVIFNNNQVNKVIYNNVTVWERESTLNALCFTALEANSTVSLIRYGSRESINLEYSVDKTNWNTFEIGTFYTLPTVNSQIYIRNTSSSTTGFIYSSWDYYNFVSSGKLKISGDITTLINKSGNILDLSVENNGFASLFSNNSSLIDATDLILPSTTLTYNCYVNMFSGCSSLVTAPELPATILTRNCYDHMFYNCSSLTSAPELPAMTLADNCYQDMFYNCESLVTAPNLPATTLAVNCYGSMFSGCTSLTTTYTLPATNYNINSYYSMFRNCTSLEIAPEIMIRYSPMRGALSYMFKGCTSLHYIKVHFLQWSIEGMSGWVDGVSSSGVFEAPYGLPYIATESGDSNSKPVGWTMQFYGTLVSRTITNITSPNAAWDDTSATITVSYKETYDTGGVITENIDTTVTFEANTGSTPRDITGSFIDTYGNTINWTVHQEAHVEIVLNWGVDADLEYSPDVLTRTGFIEFTDNANLSYITVSGSSGTLNNPHFVRPGDSRGYYGDGIDGYINLFNYVTSSSFSYRNDINFRTDAGVAEEDKKQHILDLLTTWKNQGAKIVQAWYKDAVWERYKKVTFGGPFNDANITVLGIIVCSGHIISQERYNLFWWTVTPSTTTADGRPGFKTTSNDGEGYDSTGLAMAVIYKEN